jgi:hypothetical protein
MLLVVQKFGSFGWLSISSSSIEWCHEGGTSDLLLVSQRESFLRVISGLVYFIFLQQKLCHFVYFMDFSHGLSALRGVCFTYHDSIILIVHGSLCLSGLNLGPGFLL